MFFFFFALFLIKQKRHKQKQNFQNLDKTIETKQKIVYKLRYIVLAYGGALAMNLFTTDAMSLREIEYTSKKKKRTTDKKKTELNALWN